MSDDEEPAGCACTCAGCADQGWHCQKEEQGCYYANLVRSLREKRNKARYPRRYPR